MYLMSMTNVLTINLSSPLVFSQDARFILVKVEWKFLCWSPCLGCEVLSVGGAERLVYEGKVSQSSVVECRTLI